MPNQTEILLTVILLTTGCPAASLDDQPVEQAPDPIGDELMRSEGTWAWPECARPHLYREGRLVQRQCFDPDGLFSWENLGMLTPETAAALDAELAAADFDDLEPVNYMGLCNNPDAHGTVTMWAGERSIEFAPFCLFEGMVPLYEAVEAIKTALSNCDTSWLSELESVEPGCRSY